MTLFDDDIFDEMYKMMRSPFTGFFNDSFFDEETKQDGDNKKIDKLNKSKDKDYRSYSISYKFGTGMKEPEIHIDGEVDKEIVNRFLKGLPKTPNEIGLGLQSVPELKLRETQSDTVEPFTEVQNTNDGINIYMEMPGVDQDAIKTEWNKDTLKISAKRDDLHYEKLVPITFKHNNDVKIQTNNGIITIEVQKK